MAGGKSVRLTASAVKAIKPNGTDFDVRDTEIRGFHVRVTRAGEMIYRFQYRRPDGKRPVLTLRRTSELTPDEARVLARAKMVEVAGGGDPRKARDDWKAAPTMDDLWARYEVDRLNIRNSPRTIAEYKRNWHPHAQPRLGELKVAEVSRKDISNLVAVMGAKRTTVNRVVALLSVMFSFARDQELRAENPVASFPKYRENTRDVAFTDGELSRLDAALTGEKEAWAGTALRLLMLTGARHSEVLEAEWSELHLEDEAPAWRIPAARMKGGKNHTYWLDAETAEILLAWQRDAKVVSPRWVFPNSLGTGPKSSLQKPWARVKKAAGVTRGVIHSFRHTFLTRLAEAGATAVDIQRTGGHADIATSMKYVHAAETERLRQLQEASRGGIRAAIRGKPDTVIPLARKVD